MAFMSWWRSTGLGFTLGAVTMAAAQAWWTTPEAGAGGRTLNRAGFDAALQTVIDRYVDPVEASPVLTETLKRVVSGLDPYSHYLTADERQTLRDRNKGGTAGMAVSLHRGEAGRKPAWLEVTAVLPGSPAEKAGLTSGDRILAIRGQEVAYMLSQAEVETLLAGADGDTLELAVQRRQDPAPIAAQLVLTGHPKNLVEAKLVDHGGRKFAHMRIRAFRAGTGDLFKRQLKELRRSAGKADIAGVIVDVRGNPGGDVPEAVMIADMFVPSGVLVRTRGRGGQILREERAHPAATDDAVPLVVLQDRRSASASELLAVALQDHGRARVVGERSFGKGTVQDVIGMSDGSLLTLTIARYFSPKDRLIDGNGVEPDVRVDLPPLAPGSADAGLQAALTQLASG
jgi:carboxyl-terminal processing protease